MSNEFFNASGEPDAGTTALSSEMRTEFANISAGFDKLPTLTGNAYHMVRVNAAGAALETVSCPTLVGNGNKLLGVNSFGTAFEFKGATETWTPEFVFGSGATCTYTTQVGRYTRFGSMVVFHCIVELASITKTAAEGGVYITAPVAANASATISIIQMQIEEALSAPADPFAYIAASETGFTLVTDRSTTTTTIGDGGGGGLNETHFDNNTIVRLSGFYEV